MRSLSLSSFLSSESRSNACIDYAESQKKYSRARTTASSCRRFIQSLRSSRHFCFSSLKMRCPLRFLTHFFNARHTQKCISAQSRCLFIESPQRLNASTPKHRVAILFRPVEGCLGIIKAVTSTNSVTAFYFSAIYKRLVTIDSH